MNKIILNFNTLVLDLLNPSNILKGSNVGATLAKHLGLSKIGDANKAMLFAFTLKEGKPLELDETDFDIFCDLVNNLELTHQFRFQINMIVNAAIGQANAPVQSVEPK